MLAVKYKIAHNKNNFKEFLKRIVVFVLAIELQISIYRIWMRLDFRRIGYNF